MVLSQHPDLPINPHLQIGDTCSTDSDEMLLIAQQTGMGNSHSALAYRKDTEEIMYSDGSTALEEGCNTEFTKQWTILRIGPRVKTMNSMMPVCSDNTFWLTEQSPLVLEPRGILHMLVDPFMLPRQL